MRPPPTGMVLPVIRILSVLRQVEQLKLQLRTRKRFNGQGLSRLVVEVEVWWQGIHHLPLGRRHRPSQNLQSLSVEMNRHPQRQFLRQHRHQQHRRMEEEQVGLR